MYKRKLYSALHCTQNWVYGTKHACGRKVWSNLSATYHQISNIRTFSGDNSISTMTKLLKNTYKLEVHKLYFIFIRAQPSLLFKNTNTDKLDERRKERGRPGQPIKRLFVPPAASKTTIQVVGFRRGHWSGKEEEEKIILAIMGRCSEGQTTCSW